jgi:L-ascorbate metabolism protein UlaG (beta-lactamase superfamily)
MLKKLVRITAIALVIALAGLLATGWSAFGKRALGKRLEAIEHSQQWQVSQFENPQPLKNDFLGAMLAMTQSSKFVAPSGPVPVITRSSEDFLKAPATGLRVTWFGHSSTLVEIDGYRVLTDPVFSERVSPLPFAGPKRWYAPPVSLADLPEIDAVVISHDHYDHLDMHTIRAMRAWHNVFVVPLGMGAHLAYWGIPESRIVELDWWQEKSFSRSGPFRIVLTPARHASGRMLIDNNSKLWGGFALVGAKHRVYYSGDTGLFSAMKEIGARLGPFDLTMIEVGQYHRSWPDWHIGPEQAIKAHKWVRGRVMLPVHWGLFVLAMHSWTEPIERVSKEARRRSVTIATPRPGLSFEPGLTQLSRWWPQVEWQTAQEHPIVSTQVDQ